MTHRERSRSVLSRAFVEFLVIVVSILAAFALDAWWESHGERQRVMERLEALEAELVTTRQLIAEERAQLASARTAVAAVLGHVSPDAPLVSPDSLNTLMDLSFRHGTIEFQGGLPQALQATGEAASIQSDSITSLLSTWPVALADVRTKSSMLEQNREIILEYLHGVYPTLDITHKTGEMTPYPTSAFSASVEVVQRDLRVEGLFGNRGMLIEDTDVQLVRLDEQAAEILTLTRSRLAR